MRLVPICVLVAIVACSSSEDVAIEPAPPPGTTPVGDASTPMPDAAPPPTEDAGPACSGGTGYPAGTTTAVVTVGGVSRTFRVHVPPGYRAEAPAPVVLMFHGGGGSGEQLQTASSKMDPVADREGFITVYPDGSGLIKTWNAGKCCGKAAEDDIDDAAFVNALLDDLEAKLCVDKRRIYASGMSNGAMLSHRLGCELSERFAAIAPVAGTIGVAACAPTSRVAVMHVHGTEDANVPYEGGIGCGPSEGVDFTSVVDTMAGWATRNGCTTTTKPYLQQGDGTCTAYEGCGRPVVLCSVAGKGHSWPGGEPKTGGCVEDGPQSTTFLASEAIWKFFAENPKP